jgi:hypothetical protein
VSYITYQQASARQDEFLRQAARYRRGQEARSASGRSPKPARRASVTQPRLWLKRVRVPFFA